MITAWVRGFSLTLDVRPSREVAVQFSRRSRQFLDRWMALTIRQRRLGTAAAGALIIAVIMLGVLAPSDEAPRARQYRSAKACLLTGSQGIGDEKAAPIWAGMQRASLRSQVKVQYLAVTGPESVAAARPFLGALVNLKCDLILAGGSMPATAVDSAANDFRENKFVVVGVTSGHPNVTGISAAGSKVSEEVEQVVLRSIGGK